MRPLPAIEKVKRLGVDVHRQCEILCRAHDTQGLATQRGRLARLARKIQLFDSTAHQMSAGISLPEKDRPILLAAVAARTTHLICGDLRHFGPYFGKKIEGIRIVTPSQYLKTHEPR